MAIPLPQATLDALAAELAELEQKTQRPAGRLSEAEARQGLKKLVASFAGQGIVLAKPEKKKAV